MVKGYVPIVDSGHRRPTLRFPLSGRKRSRYLAGACSFLWLFALASPVYAHPGLELRIQQITEEIEEEPGDAALLVRRGELHIEHEDWGAALYDFELAAEADPAYAPVDFHRGRLLFGIGEYAEAEYALTTFLLRARGRNDAELPVAPAHLVLGELMEATGRWRAAAVHYDKGIRLAPGANPGFYIARARALVNGGSPDYAQALKGLDDRLSRSPGLYTLAEYAIELELGRGSTDGAIARIRKLIETYPALMKWRLRLAELQRGQGAVDEAHQTYRQAQLFINSLPESSRAKMRHFGHAGAVRKGLAETQ